MIIGIPKEIKCLENRVSITPSGVNSLVNQGHRVIIQKDAGLNSGFTDCDYESVGAIIKNSPDSIWNEADLILKVKEPLKEEYKYFHEDLIIFTFLHLAGNLELTQALLEAKTTAIAYETIKVNNTLPLLTPMSEIAGKLAVSHGSTYLQTNYGGSGKLLDGAPGVPPCHVVIVGGGVVGEASIKRAIGSSARVTVLDISVERLRDLSNRYLGKIETLYSNEYNLKKVLKDADLVIACVLIPGSKAPKIISEEMIKIMKPGSVIVDVAIDQGGCVETINESTTLDNPTFIKHGVVHSAVANIPSAVSQTATQVLCNSTGRYVLNIANLGFKDSIKVNPDLLSGVNTYKGYLVCSEVANSLDLEYTDIKKIL